MGNYATQPDFATEAVSITASDTFDKTTYLNGSSLFVGGGGDVSVIMQGIEPVLDGDGLATNAVVFANVPEGTFLPAIVDYVTDTNTSASSILAIK
jgi:hypothetical protein